MKKVIDLAEILSILEKDNIKELCISVYTKDGKEHSFMVREELDATIRKLKKIMRKRAEKLSEFKDLSN